MSLIRSRFAALAAVVVVFSAAPYAGANDLLGLPPVPVPANNPMTPEKVTLGKALFLDTRFSGDGKISCASCHALTKLFTDGRALAVGINGKQGTRNSPTVTNAAYYTTLFWDGRAASLEQQAKGPLLNPIEHGLKNFDAILQIVRREKEYADQFKRAFSVDPPAITIDHVAMAIASFERSMVAGNSPFDRYQYGGDRGALSASAVRGLNVFTGKGLCTACHIIGKSDALFTDNQFHNIGIGLKKIDERLTAVINAFMEVKMHKKSVDQSVLTADDISQLGRFAVTVNPADVGDFRTPGLRNVALTAPYMHDGSLKTLEEVVEYYGKGGNKSPLQHETIRNLRLSPQEQRDLVEFMKALTSSQFANSADPGIKSANSKL